LCEEVSLQSIGCVLVEALVDGQLIFSVIPQISRV